MNHRRWPRMLRCGCPAAALRCLHAEPAGLGPCRAAGLGPAGAEQHRVLGHAGQPAVIWSLFPLLILKPACEGSRWWNNDSMELFTEVCFMVMTSDMLSLLISLAELVRDCQQKSYKTQRETHKCILLVL